ncbi:hypothetical protein [Formosa algae]|uniref:Uncharacterized protein n=1 Tax=Formosa algae TaxID=225843 RepID=A0A9X0YJX1_9FLAO|nr:hypothetical protein [Formosa algae]MBP1838514.1 hypothetical protein [Formosa algae]MDQ0335014.1 hypothetical protein [Formosa algae]
MTYLSPEIAAWSKQADTKSLVRPGVSCGIFQDCNANEKQNLDQYTLKTQKIPKDKI